MTSHRRPRRPRERYNCAKCGRKNVKTFNREIGHYLCDEDLVNYRLWRDSTKPGEILQSFFANRGNDEEEERKVKEQRS